MSDLSSPVAPALDALAEGARRRLGEGGRRVLVVDGADAARDDWGSSADHEAAWIVLPRTAGLDARELGRRLATALPSGAPIFCSLPTPCPLPAVLERVLRGTGRWSARGGAPGLSVSAWREAFGGDFSWHRARALGVLIPSRPDAAWAERNALLLGALAAAEHLVGSWPVVRGLGGRVLLEGTRR